MELRGRMSKIQLLEKTLLGDSYINIEHSENPHIWRLGKLVNELDTDWFNFMPSTFFIDKYKEEVDEFTTALNSYYINKSKFADKQELINSMRYSVVSELSDMILASSSALAENKVEEHVVLSTMRETIKTVLELSDKFGEPVFLTEVTPREVFDAHYAKLEEMVKAKRIYRACVENYEIQHGVYDEWLPMLLKLYTYEELLDPCNKMKIVKEIRRMMFAMKHFKETDKSI